MAAAAHENDNGARIFTIDYSGDPTTELPDQAWHELQAIREENLAETRKRFPGCEIQFIEGDSRAVLPGVMEQIDVWDFFYQDSMHFVEGIRAEWDVLKDQGSARCVVVFDDIGRSHPWTKFFANHEGDRWSHRAGWWRHPQLWAQKKR
jgi:hypothetical protein